MDSKRLNKISFKWLLELLDKLNGRHVLIVITLAFLGWQIATASISSSVAVCRGCHDIRIKSESLEKSPHKEINCLHCHNDEIVLSLPSLQVRSLANLTVNSLKPKKPIKPARIMDNTCKRCHPEVLKKTVRARGIRISHKEFLSENWQCVDCHGDIAHKEAGKVRNVPSMSKCMTCHDDNNASAECGYCHAKDLALNRHDTTNPLSIIHGPNIEKNHGMGDMGSCVQCHKIGFCGSEDGCHQAELPHPQPWAELHSKTLAKKEECYKCHDKVDYCDQCHQIEMPHPPEFLPNHQKMIVGQEIDIDTCWSCHTQDSCEGCHVRSAHPNLPRFYPEGPQP